MTLIFYRLNSSAALVSNYEVLKLLQEVRSGQDGGGSKKKVAKLRTDLANISFDVSRFLSLKYYRLQKYANIARKITLVSTK